MDKDRSRMTENILNLTLEIIYLLTGEDYGPMKMSRKPLISSGLPTVSGGCGSSQSPVLDTPSKVYIHERSNDQRILELASKIIELLTGEVSAKCEDEDGDSSVEDWSYLGGCKNADMKVRMETPQGRTSPDFTDDTERSGGSPSPVSSQDSVGDHNIGLTKRTEKCSSDFPDLDSPESSMEMPGLCKEQCPPKATLYTCPPYTQYSHPHVQEDSDSCGRKSIPDAKVDRRTDRSPYTYFQAKEESVSDDAENLKNSETCTDPQRYTDVHAPIDHNGESAFPPVKEEPVSGDEEPLTDHPLTSWIYTKSDSKFKKKDPMCFICVECGKSFPYKSHLLRHQKIHMEERPYSCIECGKSFKLNSNLISHQRIHTGQRPFSCSDCAKCFISKSELVKHKRIHTGEKPYPCLECGRRFSRISNLIDHNKIHTGERPYCCSECGKCFRRHSNLQSHQKTHTIDKVYSCPECSASFLTSSELLKHQKTHSEGNNISPLNAVSVL